MAVPSYTTINKCGYSKLKAEGPPLGPRGAVVLQTTPVLSPHAAVGPQGPSGHMLSYYISIFMNIYFLIIKIVWRSIWTLYRYQNYYYYIVTCKKKKRAGIPPLPTPPPPHAKHLERAGQASLRWWALFSSVPDCVCVRVRVCLFVLVCVSVCLSVSLSVFHI